MTAKTHEVEFTGNASDYFGIWIVNVLLSIVTFGIYSAWAKVRDKKYFYGNTIIDDHSFDYHATGKQIFIGRLIVGAGLLVLSILNVINPILYIIGVLGLLLVLPWIIVRALRFNARVSSYRNVRFNFVGDAGRAFLTFIILPIANLFTLYLATPFISRAIHRFTTNNHQYGDRNFEFNSDIGSYYTAFFMTLAMMIGGIVLLTAGGGGLLASLSGVLNNISEGAVIAMVIALYAVMILVIIPAMLIYKALLRNILFNNTSLDGLHQFSSDVHPGRYIWIIVSNALAAGLTFGMLIPWGRVRLAKYMAAVTHLISESSLDGYTSDVQDSAGVISSEYMDIEGFDIDIGL